MTKSLLILMLMTTQLSSGSGVSVFVCIRNDGSCICLDSGPTSCTCCKKHDGCQHCACHPDTDCEETVASNCGCHDNESPKPVQFGFLAGDSCGCTRFPVMVSSNQPTTITRSTIPVEVDQLALLAAWLPTLCSGVQVVSTQPHLGWRGPPTVPDFTLAVISTVVIRC